MGLVTGLLEQLAVSFSYLKSVDVRQRNFKFLSDISVKNGIDFEDVTLPFIEAVQTSPDRILHTTVSSEASEALRNYRNRFLLIKDDESEDFIITFLKILDPIGKERSFFIVACISLSGDKDLEEGVMQYLKTFSCLSRRTVPGDEKNYFYNNYYNDLESAQFMFRSKWRSAHGVNKYMKCFDFEWDVELGPEVESEIDACNRDWITLGGEKDLDFRMFGRYKLMAKQRDTVKLLTVRFHDKLVAYSIYRVQMGKYIFVQQAKYLSVFSPEYIQEHLGVRLEDAMMIRKYLGDICQYRLHEYFLKEAGYQAVYYLQDQHLKGLTAYKKKYFKKCLYYTREGF